MGNNALTPQDPEYIQWVRGLKSKFRQTQLKAAVSVNRELLAYYWELGAEISERQKSTTWGSGFLKLLSQDLMAEFPQVKGFSLNNLHYVKRWYLFYAESLGNCGTACSTIVQQPVAQLETGGFIEQITSIPWGHNLVIISKCDTVKEALYYVRQTINHGWSRAVLTHQIESGLFDREGSAVSNFSQTLAPEQSDLCLAENMKPSVPSIEIALSCKHIY